MPIIESVMGIQVIGNSGENIIKSPIVEAYIGSSLLDSTKVASDTPTDISTKVEQLMAAKHSHSNKAVLDKFAETNGKPTYNGIAIGGGGTGGASTAEDVSYTNTQLPNVTNVEDALNELVPKSHTHSNKDTLDKLSVSNGKLQYNGSDVGLKGDKGDTPVKGTDYWTAADKQEIIDDIHPVYYIDLTGTYPNYTCPVAMDDITAAYNAGYNLVCRCQMGAYTAALPLFVPMPAVNTWIFSGSGALESMSFSAQSFTIAITNNRVMAQNEGLMPFPIPNKLIITAGNISYQYDGSRSVDFAVQPATQLITATGGGDITLADNTEYRLTDVTTLTINYLASNFECWMRLTFAESGNITVTLPADTEYLGATPNFKNGETWELSFKDKVLAAKKVGDDDGGADGITPHIGANGNWYLDTTDTGKPSRGEKGDTGAAGADGYTPVRGTDYWTAADKQEIVNDVIAALPDGTEVSY